MDSMVANDREHVTNVHVERIGLATLYLGMWEDVPNLPRPAAIISDPPYGQSVKTNIRRNDLRRPPGGGGIIRDRPIPYPDGIIGDTDPFDPSPLLGRADIVLLWGAHKFADRLPAGS